MTTPSIFWRLVWKEYRLQRALWIAMAVLTGFLLWLFSAFAFDARERELWLFQVALAFPALYAMGCGAMLFAGEREAETYEFQRTLPVVARQIFVAKFAFALASMAALSGVMWLLAAFHNGWKLPNTNENAVMWARWGFFGLEAFLWATLFSILAKRVLVAAILGVTAASISVHIMTIHGNFDFLAEEYVSAMPQRVSIAAVLALIDFGLSCRWFRQRSDRRLRSAQPRIDASAAMPVAANVTCYGAPGRWAMLGRLLWQHWRQSVGLLATIVALFVPLVLVAIITLMDTLAREPKPPHCGDAEEILTAVAIMLALAGVPLLGMCAFLPDQWGRSYRFLADRGVPPKYVWLSRQLVALAMPLALAIAILLALFVLAAPMPELNRWMQAREHYAGIYTAAYLALIVLGYLVLGLTVGQLGSMLLRSGILAGIFSIIVTALLACWCGLMWGLGISWWWSVVPIPLALLLATRLRTPGWLLERNTPRAWLRPVLAIAIPTVAILTAIPLYRIYSVPAVDPGFSPEQYARPITPEEQTTLDLYRQVFPKLRGLPNDFWNPMGPRYSFARSGKELAWVEANQEAVALALKASRGKLPTLVNHSWERQEINTVAHLLVYSATALEEKGKLDAALEQYLTAIRISSQLRDWYPIMENGSYDANNPDRIELAVYAQLPLWAARAGQTPERILAAIRQLEQLTSRIPASGGIQPAYVRMECFLKGDLGAIDLPTNRSLPAMTVVWLHMPWERARALRLLNLMTRSQLDVLSEAERAARAGERIPQPAGGLEGDSPFWNRIDSPYALRATIWVPPVYYNTQWGTVELVRTYTALETSRRAVRVVLALEAWKLQHGSLPKTLDELVGPCLDRLPVDPFSGQPFRYFRDGLKIPLAGPLRRTELPLWSWDYYSIRYRSAIEANAPFIWSTGVAVRFEQPNKARPDRTVLDEYRLYTRGNVWNEPGVWRQPNSEYEIWDSGWPFPIPALSPSEPRATRNSIFSGSDERPFQTL